MMAAPRPALVRVTAPVLEPLTLAEAAEHLRLIASSDSPPVYPQEDKVEKLIRSVREHLDGKDGWLGRALCTQTWDLKLPGFPRSECIVIPLPPLREIVSISYVDPAGDTQTLDDSPSDWQLLAGEPARIIPAYGTVWPATRDIPDAVTIRFTAGYTVEGEESPDNPLTLMPGPIKDAMLLLIEDRFANRGNEVIGVSTANLRASDALLFPYRMQW